MSEKRKKRAKEIQEYLEWMAVELFEDGEQIDIEKMGAKLRKAIQDQDPKYYTNLCLNTLYDSIEGVNSGEVPVEVTMAASAVCSMAEATLIEFVEADTLEEIEEGWALAKELATVLNSAMKAIYQSGYKTARDRMQNKIEKVSLS